MQTIVGRILSDLVTFYLLILFVRVILEILLTMNTSFRPTGGAALLFEVVFSVTDPPLKALRRLIPPLRIGNVALDIAFLVLFIALVVIRSQVFGRI